MYLEITTRCNMTCAHCCMSATAEGKDMLLQTFRKALEFVECYGEHISIGGGEPTLHPRFWQILGECLRLESVWLATNGSITNTALALAKMAKRGVIACSLSRDAWHDEIDPRVVEAFTRKSRSTNGWHHDPNDHDCREIRTVSRVLAAGRAADWGESGECICPGPIIRVNGDIYWCGCPDSPKLGTVFDPPGWEQVNDGCYKDYVEEEEYV